MRSPLLWKYVIVMTFATVALLVSLVVTGGAEPTFIAICSGIIVLFGIYYYFRVFRSGPKE